MLQEDELLGLDNSAQIFNALSDIPGDVTDADELIKVTHSQSVSPQHGAADSPNNRFLYFFYIVLNLPFLRLPRRHQAL